jgi:hypothetical protein
MLAPPFGWRWNRGYAVVNTVVGTQDYTVALANFGWLEKASITVASATKELNVALCLSEETQQNLPTNIAVQYESVGTSVTFRLIPVPDQIYSLKINYQAAAPSFSATSGVWDPIPDYFYYLYSQGVLAKAYEYLGDERWPLSLQLFIKNLIAAYGGLTASQINMFAVEKTVTQTTVQSALATIQQAIMARGLQ